MALELDTRQRAMLQEMGVHVWLPAHGVAVLERTPAPAATASGMAGAAGARVAPTPAAPTLQTAPAGRAGQPAGALAPTPAAKQPGAVVPAVAPPDSSATATATDRTDWHALREAVQHCQACALCAGRSHTTLVAPERDSVPCDWMLLGDPPDEDEDRAGAPFAGTDGVLLANMLRALGLQRANPANPSSAGLSASGAATASPAQRAYISNVLKCRPAHGAVPQAAELARCSAWLQREIALVRPKVIVSLGRFANQLLLGESPQLAALPLGKLRGTVHRYQGVAVVVSYPPKLLMRNSADKAKAWADLCLAAATVQATPEAGR